MKKTIFIDMDGVLVQKGELNFQEHKLKKGFFLDKDPVRGAVESFQILSEMHDCYIASTPVWNNVYCWSEKRIWVEKHLGKAAEKRLILLHHKNLLNGDYLVDDTKDHGVQMFKGEHIHFGIGHFPDWPSVIEYLMSKQG
ncbi:MAG: hypothetical protein JNL57_10830 [Bacteroidetes bacterium]|nr:hypothetical protein [Bacteroidota bacterium]